MIWFDFWSKEPAVVQMCTAAVNMRTFAVLPASGLACISLKGTSRPTSLQSKSRTNISVSSFNVWFILQQFAECLQLMLSNTADPRNWTSVKTRTHELTSSPSSCERVGDKDQSKYKHVYMQWQQGQDVWTRVHSVSVLFIPLRTFLGYSGHRLAQIYQSNMKKIGALKQQWAPQRIKENQSK